MTFQRRLISRSSFLGQIGTGITGFASRSILASAIRGDGLPKYVVRPGDQTYEKARQDENARLDFRPDVIAYCRCPDDVALCVRWAAANNKTVAIRSGGHDYEGFSLNNGGMVIDLSKYRSVAVAPGGDTAVIRAGTDLGMMYHELARARRTLPGGTSPSVAVAGLTTGGGYGLMVRRHGLMCDKLRRVKMIDARGHIRDSATDKLGEDILWACRGGGGGSFGVVTDLEFDLVPIPEEVVYFSLLWAWDELRAESILMRWMSWAKDAPRELTSILTLAGGSPKTIRCTGLFLGRASTLKPMLQTLSPDSAPKRSNIESLPHIDAIDRLAGSGSSRQSWKMKSSLGANPLTSDGARAAIRQLEATPHAVTCVLEFDAFGGAVNDVKPEASAFPHRNMSYSLQYQTYWNQESARDAAFSWIRNAFSAIDPHTQRKSYRNYCDLDLTDWQRRYFADNYPRLQAIKAALDPDNLFRFPQSIELPYVAKPNSVRKSL
jgi:FAD/FMN-containing dehydrogenase